MTTAFPGAVDTATNLYTAVNGISTTLNGAIDDTVTTVTVIDTTSFPSVGYFVVDTEIINYTGKTGTSFTGCTRGSDGSTAAAHASTSTAAAYMIADHHNVLMNAIIAIEQNISDRIGLSTTQIMLPDGTSAAPSIRRSGSQVGMFFTSAGVGFGSGGSRVALVDTGGITVDVGAVTISPTTNQLVLGATRTVTINAPTPSGSSRTVTLPDLSASYSVVGTEGAQTINGAKTFSSALIITATSSHFTLSTSSNTAVIQASAQATSSRTFSIPDISGNGTFAFLEGTQTFSGAKTFSTAVTLGSGTVTTTSIHGASANVGIYFTGTSDVNLEFGNGGTRMFSVRASALLMAQSTYEVDLDSTGMYPASDNAIPCGKTGQRWSAVWAANGTIQTSASWTKGDIEEIKAEEIRIPKGIKFTRPYQKHKQKMMGFLADHLPEQCFVFVDDKGNRSEEDVYTSAVVGQLCAAVRQDYDRLAAHDLLFKNHEKRILALEKAA